MSLFDARDASYSGLFHLPVGVLSLPNLFELLSFYIFKELPMLTSTLATSSFVSPKQLIIIQQTNSIPSTTSHITSLLSGLTISLSLLGFDARSQWFNEDGTRMNPHGPGSAWSERFESCVQKPRRRDKMEEVSDEERNALFAMLRAMLAFRPEERLTAEEVMGSRWMRDWAVPGLEKMTEQ